MMDSVLSWEVLRLGMMVFFARVIDVSVGTVRTISTVHGRMKTAFILGAVEVSVWIVVVSKLIEKISDQPILVVFYALGFSTGNVVGILLERRIAFGYAGLRIFCRKKGKEMAEALRKAGFAVTTFLGQGKSGPVLEIYTVCKRRQLKDILEISQEIEPDAFFTSEHVGTVRQMVKTLEKQRTSWCDFLKRK
ncbi:MAG: DUF5698 domain-containing protein [bacterium]